MTATTGLVATAPVRLVPFGREKSERADFRLATLAQFALLGLLVGNLGRIPVFSTGDRDAALLVNDLFVALMLGWGFLSALISRSLRVDSVALLAVAFATLGGATAVLGIWRFGLTGQELAVSLGYLARWLFYFGVYVVLINALRAGDAERIWRTLESVIVAFALFGIVQSITLPDFAQLVYRDSRPQFDWDVQGRRLVSTWLDPNFAGAFLMIALVVEVALISVGKRVAAWKPMILSVALVLTASRGTALAVAVAFAVILLARGLSKRMMRISAGLIVLMGAALPLVLRFTGLSSKLGVDLSAMQRVVAWLRAARVFADHPIIGIGMNTWGFVQERYGYERNYAATFSLDGGLIFVALMTGLIGLAIYLGMIGAVVARARRVWRNTMASPEQRGLAIGIAAATVGLVVHSLFCNSLFLPFLMESLWVLWALLFVVAREARCRQ